PGDPWGAHLWPADTNHRALTVGALPGRAPPPANGRDPRTRGLGGAPAAPDDRAQVLRVYAHLQPLAATGVDHPDPDVVRMVDDALDQVLERRPQRVRPSRRRRHRPAPQSSRLPWPPWA